MTAPESESPSYIPARGDVVWVSFSPHAGHEQAGRRPALVLSPQTYNRLTGLMIACPITNAQKGYPFEVALPDGLPIRGVILSDHVKSLDWQARHVSFIAVAGDDVLNNVAERLARLLP
jgi:mRNA interferase MazF